MLIINFFDNIFHNVIWLLWSSNFWNSDSQDNKEQCFKRSISVIKSWKCKYVLKQYPVFKHLCDKLFKILFSFTFIFYFFSSDTLKVITFVLPFRNFALRMLSSLLKWNLICFQYHMIKSNTIIIKIFIQHYLSSS